MVLKAWSKSKPFKNLKNYPLLDGFVRITIGRREDYIEHPRRIASKFSTEDSQVIAWLHDVLEDSDFTAEDLLKKGIRPHCIEIVKCLTRKEDEDKIANLLGMESGDFLIYCPNPKMGMKWAQMKVFYNGKLSPLYQCKDDPIIERRLKITLDSHENLWNLKTFINPKHNDKKDSLYEACEYFFTFDKKRKLHYEKNFYKTIVKNIAEEKKLGDNLSMHRYEEKENIALSNILKASAGLKEREQIERIIINAFKR